MAHNSLQGLDYPSPSSYLSADSAFLATCELDFGLSPARCPAFLAAAVRSQDAILQMRYCQPFDVTLRNQFMPTNNWLRDDRLVKGKVSD